MNANQFVGKTILVVDDDTEMREAIAYDLRKKGGTVFTAADGTEGLTIVLNNHIDLVVSDVRMPNGDGIKLLQELRSRHPRLPIVLLCTGFADLTEPEAIKLGAVGLIEKPIDRKVMLAILEKAMIELATLDSTRSIV